MPPSWTANAEMRSAFFEFVGAAPNPLLICDYDGTLAPFRENKMHAVPYPGVTERLQQIAKGRTRLAFVSGRPVQELIALLPMAAETEVWGMHGREHRTPDVSADIKGEYTLLKPTAAQRTALNDAQAALEAQGLGGMLERKAGSVALHWRTLTGEGKMNRLKEVQAMAQEAFAPHAGKYSLAVLRFDGGLELRAEDQTKAHAAQALLGDADARSAVFLGDDTTDEDAFRVLRQRGGLALLVREPPRPSHAAFTIQPPGELLSFLEDWLHAANI